MSIDQWAAARARIIELKARHDVDGLIQELQQPVISATDAGTILDSREAATNALAKLGDERAVPALIPLLKDTNRSLALAGARALGKIGDARAVGPLIDRVGDPVEVARSMPGFGWRDVLRPLPRNEEQLVREWALGALCELDAPQAVPALNALLESENWYLRRWAASHLERFGDERALGPLRKARAREPLWRRWRFSRALRAVTKRAAPARH